jgi:hypothetical protein
MPGSAASALELVGNLLPRTDKREMIDGRTDLGLPTEPLFLALDIQLSPQG